MTDTDPPRPSSISAMSSVTLVDNKRLHDDLTVNGYTKKHDVHDTLHALHADDLAQLAQNEKHLKTVRRSYPQEVTEMISGYWSFLWATLGHSVSLMLVPKITLLQRFTVLIYLAGAAIVITILLIFCIILRFPPLIFILSTLGRLVGDELSLVNAAYPHLFVAMKPAQIAAGRLSLAEPVSQSQSKSDHRIFDLDVARFLLQCSAVMYERSSAPVRAAVRLASKAYPAKTETAAETIKTSTDAEKPALAPGQRARILLGETVLEDMMYAVMSSSGENVLQEWADGMDPPLKYSTISELDSTDSAFCGVFYDPKSTWVVVAFKGTDPTEFAEWTVDFTYMPVDASDHIPGFGQVHGGFLRRLFPAFRDDRIPYETIAAAVRVVSDQLISNCSPGQKVNVWFTGHSLGCAVSALAYAAVLSEPEDFGDNVVIRDAYLFATPIVCDSHSVRVFNERMQETKTSEGRPFVRSMWRITNRNDVVATGLPSLGDDMPNSSLRDLFAFAHLGAEIKMGSKFKPNYVTGGGLKPDTWVTIHSRLSLDVVNDMNAPPMNPVVRFLQDVPLLGRLAAHWTPMYWDTITELELGRCYWWQEKNWI